MPPAPPPKPEEKAVEKAPAPAEAAAEDGEPAAQVERRHHHRSPGKRAQSDRVARGLSIDPFEEASRSGKK
jgi:hypothetical protein